MSDTPKTDALVQEAEKICLEAGLSGMFFWREMYGRLLSRMRREEIEGKFAEPEDTFRKDAERYAILRRWMVVNDYYIKGLPQAQTESDIDRICDQELEKSEPQLPAEGEKP